MSLLSKALGFAVRAAEDGAGSEAARLRRLAIKRAAREVQPLPKPERPLLLPKPAPKSAAKPRGGQWYPNEKLGAPSADMAGFKVHDRGPHADSQSRYAVRLPGGETFGGPVADLATAQRRARLRHQSSMPNYSPEYAAAVTRGNAALVDWTPDDALTRNLGLEPSTPGPNEQLGGWLEKAYAKYLRNDFGTEADPLSSLAAKGLHFDPDMTPERWQDVANDAIMEDPIGHFTVPRHESSIAREHADPGGAGGLESYRFHGGPSPAKNGALMQAAPWLRKQPVTDNLYGIRRPPDIDHFIDEMRNAVSGENVPASLAVRPESLGRMSFPQAVEHVGKINQYRAAEMERAAAARMDNPAVHTFKEYPEGGLRWAQLKMPDELPEGYAVDPVTNEIIAGAHGSRNGPVGGWGDPRRPHLQEALTHEGDTMGHCVGGYCDDVIEGRSNIFSLRDAKGQPHVTIETAPGSSSPLGQISDVDLQNYPDLWEARTKGYARTSTAESNKGGGLAGWIERNQPDLALKYPELFEKMPSIVQIKGKQNRAPNPEYLPYVQDFVKSQKWGRVGDLGNTGLVQLPDQRYIDQNIWREKFTPEMMQSALGLNSPPDIDALVAKPHLMAPEYWDSIKHNFEGYKRGGLAVKANCGCAKCAGGLAVRRA